MASRYQYSKEEIKAIQEARNINKDKRAEARRKALELRAKGEKAEDVAKATGFHPAYVTQLVLLPNKNIGNLVMQKEGGDPIRRML